MPDAPLHTAIVAGTVTPSLLEEVATLAAAGFQVTVARDFHEARHLLSAHPPDLLVSDLKLGEYNGLHLVLRAGPATRAIIMSETDDNVLRSETERMGATFVERPLATDAFLAAALRTVARPTRSTSDIPIRPPFERRVTERRGRTGIVVPVDRRCGERRRDPAPTQHRVGGIARRTGSRG